MSKIIRVTLEDVKKTKIPEDEIQKIIDFDEKYDDPECPVLTEEFMRKNMNKERIIVSVNSDVLAKLEKNGFDVQNYVANSLSLLAKSIA